MKPILFLFSFLTSFAVTIAQPAFILSGKDAEKVDNFSVLINKGYTFEQVVNDRRLPFVVNDSLRPYKGNIYWIKIKLANTSQYAEQYQLWMHPQLNNTLYYFNANVQKWVEESAGLLVAENKRITGYMPCVLQGNTVNTLYIKAQVQPLQKFGLAILPGISIKKQAVIIHYEQFISMVWIATLLLIIAFLLYHTYLYFNFRDRVYL